MDTKPDAVATVPGSASVPMRKPDDALPAECEVKEPTGKDAKMVELLADIERTRIKTGDLVRAIQGNLSPEALKEKAAEKIKEITMGKTRDTVSRMGDMAGDVGSSLVEMVKDNLAPLAVLGVGLTWLVASQVRKSSNGYEEDEENWGSRVFEEDFQEDFDETSEAAGEAFAEGVEQVKEKTGRFAERAGDKFHDIRHRVSRTADDISERVRRNTGKIKTQSRGLLYSRPLLFAGSLLAIGATIGLILPRTKGEDRMLGKMRDDLMETIFETGRETISKVKSVADEARKAAVEEAEKQDLLTGDVEEAA